MAPWPQLTIDSERFARDGQAHQVISGSICYFRIVPDQWADRLAKLVALGANAVEVYVPWNFHEPYPGVWEFTGHANVSAFIQLAGNAGLDVLLRPGPYICAEWCMGGLPWWLLAKEPAPRLRCSDPAFLEPVERYLRKLLGKSVLGPLMRRNGGPIVAVQVENEYGYWGTDRAYLERLSALVTELAGPDVLQFTVDGVFTPETQLLGGCKGALRTASFGSRAAQRFRSLRAAQPSGPLAVMEFWVGWFTTWGGGTKATRPAAEVAAELAAMLAMGASVNIFVFAGGTSFGFSAGANLDAATGRLEPHVTSYDYDGLLTEAGALTEKFHACRKVIAAHLGRGGLGAVPSALAAPIPALSPRAVQLCEAAPLLDALSAFGASSQPPGSSHATPVPIEHLGEGSGYVLYRFAGGAEVLRALQGLPLKLYGVRDLALVLVDGKPLAMWDRSLPAPQVALPEGASQLDILVEITARVNFGPGVAERKGLDGAVRLGIRPQDERELFGWQCVPLPMKPEQLAKLPWREVSGSTSATQGPRFYRGEFLVSDDEAPADTWLRLPGFTRGFAALNGFVLGWHREEGPQLSLYAPASSLRQGRNEVIVFEMLTGPTPSAKAVALLEEAPRWSSNRVVAIKAQLREVCGFLRQVGGRQLWRLICHELGTPAILASGVAIVAAVLVALVAIFFPHVRVD